MNNQNQDDEAIRQSFYSKNRKFIEAKDKHSLSNSSIDNIYAVYNNTVIFILTIIMIYLLYKGQINLTLYLIVVPYITSGIEVCNQLYSFITQLYYTNVAINRVNIILNMSDEEIIQ